MSAARPRTVLVVDDNAAFADNVREILEDAGYAARIVATRAEAMDRAREGFDVALVDLRLPDGDGTELVARLREIAPDAQTILLTGFASLESALAAVRAGAWAYLLKPCAPPDLLHAVAQATRQIAVLEEKRDVERRARVAEKLAAVGRLMAGLSHEIKNPLNAASLQLAVLERRMRRLPANDQPALEAPLKLVQSEIKRLNGVLEDFLQFARPRELRAAPVDIGALLARVVDLLAEQAQNVGVQLDRRWAQLPTLPGEAGRLQQAIMNLVLNAIQATPTGGFVRVEAALDGAEVVLAVEDSGPGIPDAVRRSIFEPFFTTKEGGSGLGLPIVHSIVEQHGGSIAIERGAEGGARFVVRLPSSPADLRPRLDETNDGREERVDVERLR